MTESMGGLPIPEELARRVRLVIFDVDGVLTDAGVYVGTTASGETVELKRFDIQDGLGVKLLKTAGIDVAMVSGRVSAATELRARELDIPCHQADAGHKMAAVEALLEASGVTWEEVAMLADDLPDMAILERVGLRAAVANAVPQVLGVADWCTTREGGHGAAREFCDALLAARGDLDRIVGAYVHERSTP